MGLFKIKFSVSDAPALATDPDFFNRFASLIDEYKQEEGDMSVIPCSMFMHVFTSGRFNYEIEEYQGVYCVVKILHKDNDLIHLALTTHTDDNVTIGRDTIQLWLVDRLREVSKLIPGFEITLEVLDTSYEGQPETVQRIIYESFIP